jgi:hypothetical protein
MHTFWSENLKIQHHLVDLGADINKIFIKTGLHDKVSLSKEYQTHTQTDCNDIWPQTAQFYNERISTDLNLVT